VIEVVVTGTRTRELQSDSAVRTGRVTRHEAERRGAVDVASALQGEPGLQIAGGYGNTRGAQLQGLDAERVLVLRDGERVVGDQAGVIDLSEFSLSGVDRIEYVVGPSSALYGAGALGGVINIVTRPPASGSNARVRSVWQLSEPLGLDWPTSVDLEGSHRRGAWWLAPTLALLQKRAHEQLPGLPDTVLPRRLRYGAGVSAGFVDDNIETRLDGKWSHGQDRGAASEERPTLGQYVIDLPDATTRWDLRLRQRWQISASLSLEASASGQWFFGTSSKDRRDSPLDEHRRRRQNLASTEAVASWRQEARHWILGLRLERETFEQELERRSAVNGELRSDTQFEVQPRKLQSGALYGQLSQPLGADLSLVPGLRAELHEHFGTVLAPRLAARWAPGDFVVLRTALGRGFRVPSAKEYGFLFDHSALGYRVIGNPHLEPEASWGVSADADFEFAPTVRMRVSAFHNWVSNLIDVTYTGSASIGVDDYSYVNVGHARTLGGQLGFDFQALPRLRASVDHAYLFTRNDDVGQPLGGRPEHTVSSALTYEPREGTQLTLRQRTVSAAYVAPGTTSPPFSLADVIVSQRLWQTLRGQLGLLNLLDAQDDPLRVADARPVEGRLLFVALTATLNPTEPQ
jgi:outer membrane receptor for ferrienterochelin and colicins